MTKFVETIPQRHGGPSSKGDAVPRFDPEDKEQTAETWCYKIDELKQIFKWDDSTTVYYALIKLSGLAEVWYISLPTLKFSWTEWKIKIQNAFPSKRDFCESLTIMMERRKQKEEKYTKYFYEKMSLLNACKITGSNAVSCLIGGIDSHVIKMGAKASDHQTPESLLKYLSTLNESSRQSTHNSQANANKKQVADNSRKKGGDNKTEKVQCSICKKTGHVDEKCYQKLRCTYCRRKCHEISKCYLKRKDEEQSRTVA